MAIRLPHLKQLTPLKGVKSLFTAAAIFLAGLLMTVPASAGDKAKFKYNSVTAQFSCTYVDAGKPTGTIAVVSEVFAFCAFETGSLDIAKGDEFAFRQSAKAACSPGTLGPIYWHQTTAFGGTKNWADQDRAETIAGYKSQQNTVVTSLPVSSPYSQKCEP